MERHSKAAGTAEFVKKWVNILRTVPTALLFTTLTTYLLQALDCKGEHECAKALRGHYLRKMGASIARSTYALSFP